MDAIVREDTPGSAGYPRKRARTRRQLVLAGMAALAEHGPDDLTVADVAGRAGVASGTFYNHFPSVRHLVDAIGDELATGVEIGRAHLDEVAHDPAARVAIGTRQLLALARVDPLAARAFVVLFAGVPAFRARIRRTVRSAVEAGVDAGRFADRSPSVVADAALGAVVQWIRTILGGVDSDGPGDDVERLRVALALVGMPAGRTDAVLRAIERVPPVAVRPEEAAGRRAPAGGRPTLRS